MCLFLENGVPHRQKIPTKLPRVSRRKRGSCWGVRKKKNEEKVWALGEKLVSRQERAKKIKIETDKIP